MGYARRQLARLGEGLWTPLLLADPLQRPLDRGQGLRLAQGRGKSVWDHPCPLHRVYDHRMELETRQFRIDLRIYRRFVRTLANSRHGEV
jgi:hypothetical protein